MRSELSKAEQRAQQLVQQQQQQIQSLGVEKRRLQESLSWARQNATAIAERMADEQRRGHLALKNQTQVLLEERAAEKRDQDNFRQQIAAEKQRLNESQTDGKNLARKLSHLQAVRREQTS